jgi:glycosyltransferase involved in cell wall biosynthesis
LPIIASRISGNVGMLGADYAGLYPVADEAALAELLWRAESDPAWYRGLKSQCAQRKHLASPAAERASLKRLIAELD